MKNYSFILIALSLLFVSCGKPSVDEWSRFYGFTQADIIGHYEANPDESIYQELPTEGATVYNTAAIDISAVGNTAISLHIVIPGTINKTFSGPLDTQEEDRSDVVLTNVISNREKEDVMMTVYKNEQGQVRFHGRVKHYHYRYDSETEQYYLHHSENWGFDVLKAE